MWFQEAINIRTLVRSTREVGHGYQVMSANVLLPSLALRQHGISKESVA